MNEFIKDGFYLIIVFVIAWVGFYLYTRHDTIEQRVLRYDCGIAEFAPDIPTDIRNECRRRALELYNQQRMKEKE